MPRKRRNVAPVAEAAPAPNAGALVVSGGDAPRALPPLRFKDATDDDVEARVQVVEGLLAGGETYRRALRAAGLTWGDLTHAMRSRGLRGEEWADRVTRARAAGAALWADKAVETVEDATVESAPLAKLRSDVYRWRAAVQNPRDWGDAGGPGGSGGVTVQVAFVSSDPQSLRRGGGQ